MSGGGGGTGGQQTCVLSFPAVPRIACARSPRRPVAAAQVALAPGTQGGWCLKTPVGAAEALGLGLTLFLWGLRSGTAERHSLLRLRSVEGASFCLFFLYLFVLFN